MSEEQVKQQPPAPPDATAETILAFRNRPPIETHAMPDGRRVYLHGLSDYEVQQWYDDCGKTRDEEGRDRITDPMTDAKLLIRCLRDAGGQRLFNESHLTQLIELPNFVKGPLIRKALKVCGMSRVADDEILKNYAATLAGGS